MWAYIVKTLKLMLTRAWVKLFLFFTRRDKNEYFLTAVKNRKASVAEALLNLNSGIDQWRKKNALNVAVEIGNSGIDQSVKDNSLTVAVKNEKLEIVEVLLKSGIDKRGKDNALKVAVEAGQLEFTKEASTSRIGKYSSIQIGEKYFDIVKALLVSGAYPNPDYGLKIYSLFLIITIVGEDSGLNKAKKFINDQNNFTKEKNKRCNRRTI